MWVFYGECTSVYGYTLGMTCIVSHDIRLSSYHNYTKPLHCVVSQHWENIELVLKLAVTLAFPMDWVSIDETISILNRNTMISHTIEIGCVLLGGLKEVYSCKS